MSLHRQFVKLSTLVATASFLSAVQAQATGIPEKTNIGASTSLQSNTSKPSTRQAATNQGPDDSQLPKIAIYDFFPFGKQLANGRTTGILVDFTDYLSFETGIEFNKKVLPISRLIRAERQGGIDFWIAYQQQKVFPNVEFVAPIACATESIVTLEGSKIESIDDLKGLKLAYPRRGFFAKEYAPKFQHTMIAFNDRPDQVLRILNRGRIDALITSDWVLFSYLNPENGYTSHADHSLKLKTVPIKQFNLTFGISKLSKNRHLLPDITAAIKNGISKGAFKKIVHKYAEGADVTCHTGTNTSENTHF